MKAILWLLLMLGAVAAAARENLPDPTRPSNFQAAPGRTTTAEVQVQMISISGKRRFAVIDGQEVQVGGLVGKDRVVKITENEVVLDAAGVTKTLFLYPWKNGDAATPAKTGAPGLLPHTAAQPPEAGKKTPDNLPAKPSEHPTGEKPVPPPATAPRTENGYAADRRI